MSVPDGAPPKLTGDDLMGSMAQRTTNNPQMYLVGKTTPGQAATILPTALVDFAVSDGPKTPAYQPPSVLPPAPPKVT